MDGYRNEQNSGQGNPGQGNRGQGNRGPQNSGSQNSSPRNGRPPSDRWRELFDLLAKLNDKDSAREAGPRLRKSCSAMPKPAESIASI